jgi:hypothetical protein
MTACRNGVKARLSFGVLRLALFLQEPGDVVNECAGDVERGTMSNHVEPSGW